MTELNKRIYKLEIEIKNKKTIIDDMINDEK